ncbi:hypothetical protein NDU88_009197 [Pleurodeles waltl]|uniref:Uncharacterized protein n=1 Tax=Pleurodeles waltl TaxID=8319 RepID=A0AAV7P2J3_PLEWA|nr:hypothetical protein NDU88_009197 [Pleurodeles waltl]
MAASRGRWAGLRRPVTSKMAAPGEAPGRSPRPGVCPAAAPPPAPPHGLLCHRRRGCQRPRHSPEPTPPVSAARSTVQRGTGGHTRERQRDRRSRHRHGFGLSEPVTYWCSCS